MDIDIPVTIPEFYSGKNVLLTGFTGSLGKVTAEKLLYSCPDVKRIYVIVRAKRGKTPQERVNEVLQSLCFIRLREKYPDQWEHKIVALSGDMLEDRMGLSEEDEDLLRRDVDVVIHGAASVRFDDPLDVAIRQNTRGAKMMVDLALTMPNLVSFVYISTAYSNCDHLYIKEEIYPPKGDWRATIEYCTKLDPAVVHTCHKKIIAKLPNTYVFSKSLAEHVINDHRDQLPVVIVRPSIVVPAIKEPLLGWTDNKYGLLSLLVGFFFGVLRVSWVSNEEKCNYMHSDVSVRSTLIASWLTAYKSNAGDKRKSVTVYNQCEPPENSWTHADTADLYKKSGAKEDLIKDGIHYISLLFVENELWFRWNTFIQHTIPAFVVDRILVLLKKKPMLFMGRLKIFIATTALRYFTSRTFEFETTNFSNMLKLLKPEDKEAFDWDFEKDRPLKIFNAGFQMNKKLLLKPIYDEIEENAKRLRLLYIVDRSSFYLAYGIVIWTLYTFSIPQKIISLIISFFILP